MRDISLIFLNNEGRALLYLRDDKPTILAPNHWALLGGSIEQEETPYQAITRELQEEIDCPVYDIKFVEELNIRNHPLYGDENVHLFKGRVEEKLENIQLFEGQRLGYFTFDEFKVLKFPDFMHQYFITNRKNFF